MLARLLASICLIGCLIASQVALAANYSDARTACLENGEAVLIIVRGSGEETAVGDLIDSLEAVAYPAEPMVIDLAPPVVSQGRAIQGIPARWRGIQTPFVSALRLEDDQPIAAGVLEMPATVEQVAAFMNHAKKRHSIPPRAQAAIRSGALQASWGHDADGTFDPIESYTARNASMMQECSLYGCADCLDSVAAICSSGQCSSGRRGLFKRQRLLDGRGVFRRR